MAETHIIAKEGCCFTPQSLRLLNKAIACGQGVSFDGAYGVSPLNVTAEGGGRNVRINAGSAFVEGDRFAGEGMYFVSNDSPVVLTIPPGDAADPRCDLIVARIPETGSTCWELAVIQGIPLPEPECPPVPDSALVLAEVTSPAGAGVITNDDVRDVRQSYTTCTGEGVWRDFTPEFSNTNFDTVVARYTETGDTVTVRVRGHATSMPDAFYVTTPVTGRFYPGWTVGLGTAAVRSDLRTGATSKMGTVVPVGSQALERVTVMAPRFIEGTVNDPDSADFEYRPWQGGFPIAWLDGGEFGMTYTYERA